MNNCEEITICIGDGGLENMKENKEDVNLIKKALVLLQGEEDPKDKLLAICLSEQKREKAM